MENEKVVLNRTVEVEGVEREVVYYCMICSKLDKGRWKEFLKQNTDKVLESCVCFKCIRTHGIEEITALWDKAGFQYSKLEGKGDGSDEIQK